VEDGDLVPAGAMNLYRRRRFQPFPNLLDLGWKIVVAPSPLGSTRPWIEEKPRPRPPTLFRTARCIARMQRPAIRGNSPHRHLSPRPRSR
jgi:hypothetical protein